jgi:hypothetical protein
VALAEKAIKEVVAKTPERYAARVRWMAAIYVLLDLISIAIIVTIIWRFRFFVTLAQRSNVETLVIAITFILAVYYLATTFKGFIGALRVIGFNLPLLWTKERERVERRKHTALPPGKASKSAYFDQAIVMEGKPDEPIKFEVGDEAGKLGELEIDGVEVTFYPLKDGMNDSLFEFVADQIQEAMQKRDKEAKLQITQWSTIDEDTASAYHRTVQAFQSLGRQLGANGYTWPTEEISQEDVDQIQAKIRTLVPALRNESLLPDVEYQVEYRVPILPEPLAFMQLSRRENRVDPAITMGYAMIIMLVVMLLLTFMILWPPWVPSR